MQFAWYSEGSANATLFQVSQPDDPNRNVSEPRIQRSEVSRGRPLTSLRCVRGSGRHSSREGDNYGRELRPFGGLAL